MAEPTIWTFGMSDGYRCHFRHYPTIPVPRARVVCIHGIQSHGGWYDASCRALAAAGFDTFFLDRRGSGLNRACRGDTPHFRRLIDDAAEFVASQRFGDGTPTFLVAISWGGKIGVGLGYRRPGLIDGLALIAPGFHPQIRPSSNERLRIARAALVNPQRLTAIPLNDPALFTANEHWRHFIATDRLTLRDATARFFVESAKFDFYLRRAAASFDMPTLLMLAGRDRIIDNAQTRHFVSRLATNDVSIREYPDAHHTLEFEPDPTPIFGDLVAWMDRVAANKRSEATR